MLSNENPILKTTPYLDRDNKDVIDTMTHFDDVVSHDSNRQKTPPSQSANTVNQEEVWKPFSMIDNVAIEDGLESGDELTPVPVDGGRYDVSIKVMVTEALELCVDFLIQAFFTELRCK